MRKKVTVAELIEKLKTMPQDYVVTFDNLDIDLEYSIEIHDDWEEVDFHV